MSDVERLLSEYITEHRAAGQADPVAYLDQLEGIDREELAVLLDGYLQQAPGREWDAEAYQGSSAERLTESLAKSLSGQAGLWPVLLPRLRERAQIKRAELVEKLAAGLGVGESTEKVAGYYHEMEQGTLEAEGVSGRVLDALAGIVGASAESLRRAGQNLAGGTVMAERADPAFTRVVKGAIEGDEPAATAAPSAGRTAEPADWDEVDQLFRGG
ncbi:MAG: hypothetical protein ACR2G3_11730 [Solirubrobacterales bacterium]